MKPMSKERRDTLREEVRYVKASMGKPSAAVEAIIELLEDSDFWREQVRMMGPELHEVNADRWFCVWCGENTQHQRDCRWVLAES